MTNISRLPRRSFEKSARKRSCGIFYKGCGDPSRPLPAQTTVTDDRFLSGIQAHPFFTEERPALITEQQFVEAGVKMIADLGPEEYLRNVLENLKGNWI